MNLLQLDLLAGTAFPRGREHERRGGEVLDGDADRLVQRDLFVGASPDTGPGDDLPELDDPSRPRGSSSGAPAGSGANAESRCSTTTTSARSTIAGSSSEPPLRVDPTELTCAPGLSHSKRTTGSGEAVVAWTTSAPRTASSNSPRPATRTSAKSRARGNISCDERDCTPVPRIASTRASGRASRRVASAAAAAVRIAVMYVPSMSATGVPVFGSKSAMAA